LLWTLSIVMITLNFWCRNFGMGPMRLTFGQIPTLDVIVTKYTFNINANAFDLVPYRTVVIMVVVS